MAVYKVPQDVEAEDKLIGPFSFRQFVYLIVAALGIFLAWALSQVFIGLFILPMPIVLAMLALALPLRKDQPMETYLIAMLKFFFKPRHRMWDPEGTISMVQITVPRAIEGPQVKDFSGAEASQQLSYLAQVVDSQGWSTRGTTGSNDGLSDIFVAEATHAEDMLDSTSGVAQAFDQRIAVSDDARMTAVRQQMQGVASQPPVPPPLPPLPAAQAATATPQTEDPAGATDASGLRYNPYPSSMHQHVLSTSGQLGDGQVATTQPLAQSQPSEAPVSPDILRLANNNNLSISAIAREAHRIADDDGQEVVISLR